MKKNWIEKLAIESGVEKKPIRAKTKENVVGFWLSNEQMAKLRAKAKASGISEGQAAKAIVVITLENLKE